MVRLIIRTHPKNRFRAEGRNFAGEAQVGRRGISGYFEPETKRRSPKFRTAAPEWIFRIGSSLILAGSLGWPLATQAGEPTVTLHIPATLVRAEEIVPIEMRVDSAGHQINAVEASWRYSSPGLTVIRVVRNENALPLWPQLPSWNASTGTLTMVGGRPGGLVAADALIATIFVRATIPGLYQFVLDVPRSGVYLHDGKGTRMAPNSFRQEVAVSDPLVGGLHVTSSTHPDPAVWYARPRVELAWETEPGTDYSYRFSQNIEDTPDVTPEGSRGNVVLEDQPDGAYYFTIRSRGQSGGWSFDVQRAVLIDTTPPEPLALEIIPAGDLQGRAAIAWHAGDRMSGVIKSELQIGSQPARPAGSPVLLEPAWAGQRAVVTVTDGAGNTQTAAITLPGRRLGKIGWAVWIIPVLVLVAIWGWMQWRVRRGRASRRQ